MKTRFVSALYCAPVCLLPGAALAQQYSPGYVWDRSADWVPGLVANSSQGNPRPDGEGNAVWSYEWVEGGGLGSANEWYAQPSNLLVWDPDWYGINNGRAWTRNDNVNPPIFQDRMTHNVHVDSSSAIPLLRWVNPAGATRVDIEGALNVIWSGHELFGVPVAVDVVIAHNDFSTGVTTPLLATTVDKPQPFPTVLDSTSIDVDITSIELDEGDSLLFSLRGQRAFEGDGRWVIMEDAVQIIHTPIPAPGAIALIGLAGAVTLRRRR
jgi:uncharacterized protein (TIGR03382 family)